ncbi:MAG: chorismate-binding protein [Crocinitomicaceae bacterium]|nr:chorismate-binding protein [Crocinitomicaceae bacterium]
MTQQLQYRIPGRKSVSKKGRFTEVKDFNTLEGFVVSSFDKHRKFHFLEEGTDSVPESSVSPPYCLTKEEYLKDAELFLQELKEGGLNKSVFSRVKQVAFEADEDEVYNELCSAYPEAFVYLISSALFGTWVGATPEFLLSANESKATTLSLAGTLKSDDKNDWSSKEEHEQEYVSEFIQSRLNTAGVTDVERRERVDVMAGPVKHLGTEFTFSMINRSASEIANILHPTPAVSGQPQKESLELIAKHERHDRSLYAGIIGVIGKADTQLFVNLRCAQLFDQNAFLYLGGGFTKDSIIEKEWDETENKAKTLQNIMENL